MYIGIGLIILALLFVAVSEFKQELSDENRRYYQIAAAVSFIVGIIVWIGSSSSSTSSSVDHSQMYEVVVEDEPIQPSIQPKEKESLASVTFHYM